MKKSIFSLFLALVILTSAIPTVGSSGNYDLLATYISTNGTPDSNGIMTISGNLINLEKSLEYHFTMQKLVDSIRFQLMTVSTSAPGIVSLTSMEITADSTTADIDFYMALSDSGEYSDAITDSRTISRADYSYGQKFTLSKGGEIITADQASAHYTTTVRTLCEYWHRFLLSELGFTLIDLGFTSFRCRENLGYYSITGKAKGVCSGKTVITLTDRHGNQISTIADEATGAYGFYGMGVCILTITVTGENCVPYECKGVEVDGDIFFDYTINLLGDINGDAKVNTKDWSMLYNHVTETETLSGYNLDCADVNGDGEVNIKDWTRLYNHITEFDPLWPSQEDVTLTVWAPNEDIESGWLSKQLEAFEKEHSDYNITWNIMMCYEADAAQTLIDNPSFAPDVYMFDSGHISRLYDIGALAKLEGNYAEQVRNDNVPAMIQSVTYADGELYGFPTTPDTWFMYYNKAIFSESDVQSLDTMLSKGKVAFDWGNGWYNGSFFFGAGGTLFGPDGIDGSAGVDFKGPIGNAVAQKMVEMYNSGNLCSAGLGADVQMLIDGTVGAIFSGHWNYETLKHKLGDNLGVASLPTFTAGGQDYRMNAFAGSKAIGVNGAIRDSDKMSLATELASFLASEDSQLKRFEFCGVTPVHKNLHDSSAVKNNPVASVELQVVNNCAIAMPCIPEMGNYWSPMQMFGENIVYGTVTVENAAAMLDQIIQIINR